MIEREHYKDAILDALARESNVAEFVSFAPDLGQRYAWIRGFPPNRAFESPRQAIAALLERASEHSVNIRSFEPRNPKSREFIYGRGDVDSVVGDVQRLARQGLYTIVNETIDVNDGGVSGVAYGDVFEFAPADTPRAVEKPGTAALDRALALRLFETVYGVALAVPTNPNLRVEFSLHPLRRGYRYEHTIIWEAEDAGGPPSAPSVAWPNLFSQWIGDKAFGLLIAHLLGLLVPHTQVIGRRVAPFAFGHDTGLAEIWIRTCPTQQMPGRFTTKHGWLDPFRLMHEEDPGGTMIASILSQRGVDARYSGALIAQMDGDPLIEGVTGYGDEFMIGRRAPEDLPAAVRGEVLALYRHAAERLGPVRFEWVYDGRRVWVVQLHKGASVTRQRTIVPGESARDRYFDVTLGIDALRTLIDEVKDTGDGIILVGRVGITSHFGDLLRRARIPSRLQESA